MGNILASMVTYKADEIDKYIRDITSDLNVKTDRIDLFINSKKSIILILAIGFLVLLSVLYIL